jgi:hypothetical protein
MDNTNIKKNNKSNIGCFIKTLFLVAIPYLFFYVNNTIKIKDNENEQIGLYQIDLKKTNFTVPYDFCERQKSLFLNQVKRIKIEYFGGIRQTLMPFFEYAA